ncbi:MAG: ChrR family anti-sigma-E factor [Gammaproteobacteria bacterium]|nr:ChrR family anti-sigma-E factor [Gammaproteobacteria bacterium]
MNTEVKLHPSSELLNQFVHGELAAGKSIVVSAHMELCESCSAKAKELQALAVSSWVDPSSAVQSDQTSEADYVNMVAAIVTSSQIKSAPIEDLVEVDIDVLDHSIKLPKVLAKAASQGLKWKKVAGGISEAQLFIDDETQCEFIYMAPGGKVPVHTHQGSEATLVLEGSFEDELGEYKTSDFIIRDAQHNHQPRSKEGCLCFSVLDSPLQFTEGLARLMNPLNRYKFKKATSRVA